MRRSQYQEESLFIVTNFDDISKELDLSEYTSYGM